MENNHLKCLPRHTEIYRRITIWNNMEKCNNILENASEHILTKKKQNKI